MLSLISKDKINKHSFVIDKTIRFVVSLIVKVNKLHDVFLIQIEFEEIHIEKYVSLEIAKIQL